VLHVVTHMREMDRREIFLMLPDFVESSFAAVTSLMADKARVALGVGLDGSPFCAVVLLICKSESSPWLATASLFATDDFPKLAPWLIRHVRRRVIPALLADGVNRVEARALECYAATRRFLRACGAREEARLVDQGPNGEPYVLCAWRRSDWGRHD
jgi:hypothetical protein